MSEGGHAGLERRSWRSSGSSARRACGFHRCVAAAPTSSCSTDARPGTVPTCARAPLLVPGPSPRPPSLAPRPSTPQRTRRPPLLVARLLPLPHLRHDRLQRLCAHRRAHRPGALRRRRGRGRALGRRRPRRLDQGAPRARRVHRPGRWRRTAHDGLADEVPRRVRVRVRVPVGQRRARLGQRHARQPGACRLCSFSVARGERS